MEENRLPERISENFTDVKGGDRARDKRDAIAGLAPAAPVITSAAAFAANGDPAPSGCAAIVRKGVDYVVCRFDPARDDIRLFWANGAGEPYGHFNVVNEALAEQGEHLVFAMNAGMYHRDRSAVGALTIAGETLAPLNLNDGPGNFHLKPNGVFVLHQIDEGARDATVQESAKFAAAGPFIHSVTQSGPMLVIDGDIHPRFLPDSDSLKRRNGVGACRNGEIAFVIADTPVRFHDFAIFFRDDLGCDNALYLDGTISRLYAPALGRNDAGLAMGPIVGVVAPRQD